MSAEFTCPNCQAGLEPFQVKKEGPNKGRCFVSCKTCQDGPSSYFRFIDIEGNVVEPAPRQPSQPVATSLPPWQKPKPSSLSISSSSSSSSSAPPQWQSNKRQHSDSSTTVAVSSQTLEEAVTMLAVSMRDIDTLKAEVCELKNMLLQVLQILNKIDSN